MKKEIIAKTFTPYYDSIEDRIRFVINYQDYENRKDVMITRSMIINLLSTAEDFLQQHNPEASLNPSKRVESNSTQLKAQQEKLSQTDNTNLTLLQKDEELLLEVSFSYEKKSELFQVAFKTKESVVHSSLTKENFVQVFSVLKSAVPHFHWGIAAF